MEYNSPVDLFPPSPCDLFGTAEENEEEYVCMCACMCLSVLRSICVDVEVDAVLIAAFMKEPERTPYEPSPAHDEKRRTADEALVIVGYASRFVYPVLCIDVHTPYTVTQHSKGEHRVYTAHTAEL
jgi:hypothetical protein